MQVQDMLKTKDGVEKLKTGKMQGEMNRYSQGGDRMGLSFTNMTNRGSIIGGGGAQAFGHRRTLRGGHGSMYIGGNVTRESITGGVGASGNPVSVDPGVDVNFLNNLMEEDKSGGTY
jgi:hypothetical protein